jgi:hypothetical protein
MTESECQTKIIQFLFSKGIYAFKVINATTNGHTDITACLNGKYLGIEVKRDNAHPTPLQEYTHKRIMKSGGAVMVVRPSSLDQFKEAINNLLKPKAKK